MLAPLPQPVTAAPARTPAREGFGRRWPFLTLFLLVIASNVAGSVFNFGYNTFVIVRGYMDAGQMAAFWRVASPLYNSLAYPLCLSVMLYLMWPLLRCRQRLLAGQNVSAECLAFC